MSELSGNSIDSLVTDPPSGISFMGKDWDKDKGGRDEWVKWLAGVMKEAIRVMKPGAYGLVWALPRTSHWTATALEDAGFEIRDVVMHLFGSGFPKSHDISKAIDRAAGADREIVGYKDGVGGDNLNDIVNGKDVRSTDEEGAKGIGAYGVGAKQTRVEVAITEPSTPEAKKWEGWGTALKPSYEAWVLIRKPYITIAVDSLIGECADEWGRLFCQLIFSANPVVENLLLNRKESAGALNSARWLAEVLTTLGSLEVLEPMDMFRLPETESTLWSIGWLWSVILAEFFSQENTFTIETETALITELRILKSLTYPLTEKNMLPFAMSQNGTKLFAPIAENCLSATEEKLYCILKLIAPKTAIGKAIITNLECKKSSRNTNETTQENLLNPKAKCAILIRKPFKGSTYENVLKHGTGALNIDASRIPVNGEQIVTPQSNPESRGGVVGTDFGISRASQEMFQEAQRASIERTKTLGRWPAHVVLSHNPDCVQIGTRKVGAGEYEEKGGSRPGGFVSTGSDKGEPVPCGPMYGEEEVPVYRCSEGCSVNELDSQSGSLQSRAASGPDRTPIYGRNSYFESVTTNDRRCDNYADIGGASRFFWVAKPATSEKNENIVEGRNNHPTVKAVDLMCYLIRMITPPGGIVLDCFAGSGTTLVAAESLGFGWIGYEKEQEYANIANARLSQRSLFNLGE